MSPVAWREVGVGAVLALGILGAVLAMQVTPSPIDLLLQLVR